MGTERERDGNESNSGDGNGDEDGNGNGNRNGNEDRIGEGGREAKKRKKAHQVCRRHVGNGGDLGRMSKTSRKERAGPVASNPDNL